VQLNPAQPQPSHQPQPNPVQSPAQSPAQPSPADRSHLGIATAHERPGPTMRMRRKWTMVSTRIRSVGSRAALLEQL
jgi:hypothetical protein